MTTDADLRAERDLLCALAHCFPSLRFRLGAFVGSSDGTTFDTPGFVIEAHAPAGLAGTLVVTRAMLDKGLDVASAIDALVTSHERQEV